MKEENAGARPNAKNAAERLVDRFLIGSHLREKTKLTRISHTLSHAIFGTPIGVIHLMGNF